jgi:hypothetical protein
MLTVFLSNCLSVRAKPAPSFDFLFSSIFCVWLVIKTEVYDGIAIRDFDPTRLNPHFREDRILHALLKLHQEDELIGLEFN